MENKTTNKESAMSKIMDFAKANPFTTRLMVVSVVTTICDALVSIAQAFASRKD